MIFDETYIITKDITCKRTVSANLTQCDETQINKYLDYAIKDDVRKRHKFTHVFEFYVIYYKISPSWMDRGIEIRYSEIFRSMTQSLHEKC